MAVKDLQSNLENVFAMDAAIAGNGTVYSNAVDMAHYDLGYMFTLLCDAYTDGTHTVTLQDADDAAFTVNVQDIDNQSLKWLGPDQVAAEIGIEITAINALDDVLPKVGAFSTNRYLRLKVETTGAATGANIKSICVRKSEYLPK